MPKAENRKRSANLKGQVPNRGSHSTVDSLASNLERDRAKINKQDIIERMKSIQQKRADQAQGSTGRDF